MSAISRAVAALAQIKIEAREGLEPDAVPLLDAAIGVLLELPTVRDPSPTQPGMVIDPVAREAIALAGGDPDRRSEGRVMWAYSVRPVGCDGGPRVFVSWCLAGAFLQAAKAWPDALHFAWVGIRSFPR